MQYLIIEKEILVQHNKNGQRYQEINKISEYPVSTTNMLNGDI